MRTERVAVRFCRYVIPGGLVPVEIDVERDEGRNVEPGFWMRHRCG